MWKNTYFSINNGKYEFSRMPFGLPNAPRIFQRAMDDILKEQIGKTCHVYMDDIILFSNLIERHYIDLNQIINILLSANMKIFLEKRTNRENMSCLHGRHYNILKFD